MPRKRKNKSVNTSGEREQKVHVSSVQNQTPSIPTIHGMESQLNNTNNSNFNLQHSTPVTPSNAVSFQNCQTNQFTPFGPQGPQSQFAGYVSPIPNQHQVQQQQPDMILDTLRVMSNKLEQISTKLNKLDIIDTRLTELERNVVSVNTELKSMKAKVNGVEECVTFINNQYEDQKKNINEIKKSVSSMSDENEAFLKELNAVRTEFEHLNERHLDLQMRSMRDNLIFEGIKEMQNENTEEALREFMKTEMNITDEPQFHRVHRMGKKIQGKHRPIVAKFVLYKERERIRKAAPSTLSGKPFGINEQFPKEINDRRKVLYPQYKQAKRMGKKAVMIADKLFVDGMQIFPTTNQNMPTENQPYRTSTTDSRARPPPPARVYSRNANTH